MRKLLVLPFICLLLCLSRAGMAEDYLVTDSDNGVNTTATGAIDTGNAALNAALVQLGEGDLLDAINSLNKLGSTDGADRYAAYAKAMLALLREDPATAEAALRDIAGYLDSAYQLALMQATRLHRFSQDGRFGFVDQTGAWKIDPQFDWAERTFRRESAPYHDPGKADFQPEELFRVAVVFSGTTQITQTDTEPLAGLYGLIRSDGALVAPVKYTAVLWAKNGYAAVTDGSQAYLFDITTAQPVGEGFDAVGEFSGGYIAVKKNNLWGYLNPKTGKYLGDGMVWESALPFAEGLAGVSQNGMFGFINQTGEVAIPLQFAGVASFGEGLAGIRVQKRWGFIDAAGTVAVQPTYAEVQSFRYGQCAVRKGDLWGLINAKGQVTLRLKYSEIGAFDPIYHRAWIRQNKLWGLVSPAGNMVLRPTWGYHDEFAGNTLCRVAYRGSYAFVDASGKTRIYGDFAAASPFRADYAGVMEEGGAVRYVSKTASSFTVQTTVPVECLCGFIEGRSITLTQRDAVDAEGNPVMLEDRAITYALFDSAGKSIVVPPFQGAQG